MICPACMRLERIEAGLRAELDEPGHVTKGEIAELLEQVGPPVPHVHGPTDDDGFPHVLS